MRASVVGVAPRRQIEPVRHDREARGGRHAERNEVVTDLLAHGDQDIGRAGEDSFGEPKDALATGVEIAAEHVAVVGVDDRARSVVAGDECSDPTRCARLGRVRVEHVELRLQQDPADCQDRPRVGPDRELTL